MILHETKIQGLYVIEPEVKVDERGYFMRTFCKNELAEKGLDFNIVQINRSLTKQKGVIRGMHFQEDPKAEIKIVSCSKGMIYDVAVDLRKNSSTFGQWIVTELSEKNKKLFYIPKGCAHGFQTMTENCETQYFMSEFYSPKYASGVRWNDPFLNIFWPIENPISSEQDKNWPLIKKN